MKKSDAMDDTKIRISGIDALNKALGPSAALRFLALLQRETTDDVEVSRKLNKSQSIDDIFDRAQENWRG